MSLKFSFAKKPSAKNDIAVIAFYHDKMKSAAQELDSACGGFIKHAASGNKKFSGKPGETLLLSLPKGSEFPRVMCLGLGDPKNLGLLEAETAGGKLFAALNGTGAQKVCILGENDKTFKKCAPEEITAHLALGIKLRSYEFTKYKSKKQKTAETLSTVEVIANAKTAKIFAVQEKIAGGVFTARDLVNEPPNILTPVYFADYLNKTLKPLGVEIDILDEKKMQKLGMGALLAVAQGSENPPRLVVMRWKGSAKNAKEEPLALVGKGVTFDTGGISIKPGAGMEEMKMDMGGAAAVAGTIQAIAARKSSAHVVGIVGLVENMPSGKAYRPADILTSLSGKTIEVLNTDAEGRLVLADALTYVQRTYKPRAIIDLATLTGAMMVALGHEYCGTFVNDNRLWRQMESASTATGEKLWRMPLDEVWRKDMESPTADLQNLGKSGRYAGACTAAGFLEHFIENETPWAHMDIAGTAWRKSDQPTVPKFGTGFGVRILDRMISEHYE